METSFQKFLNRTLGDSPIEIFALAGDASARRYFRIVKGHQSFVLMSWEPFEAAKYPFLSVQKSFAGSGVLVPEVIAMSPEEGLLLLEDLGDLTLERKYWENKDFAPVLPYYQMSLDELFKIHFHTLKQPSSTASETEFDVAKFKWEFNYAVEHFLAKLCDLNLSPTQKSMLDHTGTVLAEHLYEQPQWICHRDYHSRNLMIKNGKVRVIDFQDARRGPLAYDLVSLLRDSYVQLSDSQIDELKDAFWSGSRPYVSGKLTRNAFDDSFELQTVQRCFKAIGSFSSFWNQRQDRRYLKYIPGTMKRVLKSLPLFPQFKDFSVFLIDSGVTEKKFE